MAHQDLPPAEGFPEVKYRRYLPKRGPSGLVILAGITALSTFGFYRVSQGNLERRYDSKRSKRESDFNNVFLKNLEN